MDKKELIKKLRAFKKKIERKYGIEKIIFFGSRARKKSVKEETDVDLIVVGRFKEKTNLKRAPSLYSEWDIELPVDFLCYTPKEFEKLKNKISIIKDALSEGIIIR